MSEKSVFAERMDRVQEAVSPLLKSAGFRKRDRAYNRRLEQGLVHIVNFQMGQYPIGDYEIPGVRESLYGRFTVNLGVFTPCMYFVENSVEEKDFYQEYQCSIRERLGQLANGQETWWWLTGDAEETAKVMVRLFEEHVFGFFEQFRSYEDVCAYYDKHGDLPDCNAGRSELVIAIILTHLNRRDKALALLRQLVRTTTHVGFLQHVLDISGKSGYDLTDEEFAVDVASPQVQRALAMLRSLKHRQKGEDGER